MGYYNYTVSKKVPTFELSVTLSNLNQFSIICTAGKRMKFATKPMWQYPPHLRYVATLPWEIKDSIFLQIFSRYGRKCKQIAILITSNFASLSGYWLQIKFFMSLFFTYLLLWSICGTGNLPQQMLLQCMSTINMVCSDDDMILIKMLFAISMGKDSPF